MRVTILDLARFFAALSVVFYHYISRPEANAYQWFSPVTEFGYLGVPLFFMISGFVISASASNRKAVEFAISRFVRLYPVYWMGVLFTVIVMLALDDFRFSLLEVLANLTMLNDYIDIRDIDGVYWTLHAELKFYACVFILLLFRVFDRHRIWLTLWTVITVTYLLFNQPYYMGWFISPHYSSFFIAGVVYYLIMKEGVCRLYAVILAVSLVISSIRAFQQVPEFISTADMQTRIIAVILIWIFYAFFMAVSTGRLKAGDKKLYLILGGLTYPLYLIHSVAGKALIDRFRNLLTEHVAILLVIIFMLWVSYIIHVKFEKRVAPWLKTFLNANWLKLTLYLSRTRFNDLDTKPK